MPIRAVILRRVAIATLDDSRAAWRKHRAKPTVASARAALRSCVLASRALRRVAAAVPRESSQMLAKADKIDAAAAELKIEAVELLEAAESAELDDVLAALE